MVVGADGSICCSSCSDGSVTRQPDHHQADHTNAATAQLVRIMNQWESITPGDCRIWISAWSAMDCLDCCQTRQGLTDHTDHYEDTYRALYSYTPWTLSVVNSCHILTLTSPS